jgi:predicted DNA-binding protein (UPF0251 family)
MTGLLTNHAFIHICVRICQLRQNQAAQEMNANRERFPTTGAGATAKVTLRLTRGELLVLDRFCAERKLPAARSCGGP